MVLQPRNRIRPGRRRPFHLLGRGLKQAAARLAFLIGEPATVWQESSLPSAMQGVAVDADHYYVSLTDELRKYQRSDDALQWTVSTDGDYIDAGTSQTNGAHVRDGKIYLGMLGGSDHENTSGIMVRNTSDGSFVRNIAVNGIGESLTMRSCEGGAFRPGTDRFFAVGRHIDADGGAQIYREIDLSDEANPSFIADHKYFEGTGLTPNDTGGGGQGVEWVTADDGTQYIFTTIHNNNSPQYQTVVISRWTGSGLEFVSRRREPVYDHTPDHVAGQGLHLSPDGTEMWWSGRINSVDNGFVIRTSVEAVEPNENAFPNAVNNVFGSDLKVWLRLDEDSVADEDELANSGDGDYTATLKQAGTDPPLPEPQRTPRYQSQNHGFWFYGESDAGSYVDLAGSALTFEIDKPWTFACVASRDFSAGSSTTPTLYGATSSDQSSWLQIRTAANTEDLRVFIRADDGTDALDGETTSTPFLTNEPVRVVVTFDGDGACDIYINGELESSHTVDTAKTVSLDVEYLATNGGFFSRFWLGHLDEPIIAKRYLSAADVEKLDDAMMGN